MPLSLHTVTIGDAHDHWIQPFRKHSFSKRNVHKTPGFETYDRGTFEVNTLFADSAAKPWTWVCPFQQPLHHCELMLLLFLLVLHRSAGPPRSVLVLKPACAMRCVRLDCARSHVQMHKWKSIWDCSHMTESSHCNCTTYDSLFFFRGCVFFSST